MNFKQWGMGVRVILAILLSLPLIGFAAVSWYSFAVINDLVEVTKKAIVELPAEKGMEVATLLARVHDKSEVTMFFVPLVSAGLVTLASGFVAWTFFSRLADECSKVWTSAQQMTGLGERFSLSSDKLTVGANQSSAALEQSIGSLESLSSALQRTATDIGEADKAARVAADESVRGEGELQTVVSSLGELSSQSRKLEEIINVIDSIAFQTNILAVNAAVEAARAGEQGRGFAIVAEAVRNLAQHSAASAKNITSLIRDSGETSKKAMNAVRNGAESLGTAVGQVRRSQHLIHKISTSTHDLMGALTQISQSLGHLDSATRAVFSTVEQPSASPDKINEQILELQTSATNLAQILLNLESKGSEEEQPQAAKPEAQMTAAEKPQAKKPDAKAVERPHQAKAVHQPVMKARAGVPETSLKQSRGTVSGQTAIARPKAPVKLRAKDVIPFEGESESETSTEVKLGTTSGF